jgi:hypothetical protein
MEAILTIILLALLVVIGLAILDRLNKIIGRL